MLRPTKQKESIKPMSKAPITNDPRFASVHSDPRFALSRRKNTKVTIDKRFKRMLEDEDFLNTAEVDKYGRKLGTEAGKKKIKDYYHLEDEGEDEESSEEEGEKPAVYDPARGEGIIDTSDESETDGEVEVEGGAEEEEGVGEEIPTGDVYRRLAVVNLDWDNVRAVDLMAALSSFKPDDGKVLSVRVYPSEFGKERLEREEMEGPPKEIFTTKNGEEDEEEEINEKTIIKTDDGEEFDSTRLRDYQLERLRYYYAVVECDSKATAKKIYDECDGAEYEASANFFDLRFVPDETSFEEDTPRDECTQLLVGYKPSEFVTDALQHSKVKLTWDQDDPARKNKTKKAFSQREIEEMDLKEYLASSDSEEEDAEELKKKYRVLLNLSGKIGGKERDEVTGDMEITFTSGLMGDNKGNEKEPDHKETTIEKYKRKEKERMKARKAAYDAKKRGVRAAEEDQDSTEEQPDLGFNDPFFQEEEPTVTKKEKKKADKEAKKKEAAEKAAQRAELELLMMGDANERAVAGGNMKHFNLKEVVKAEKEKKLKKRKRGKKAVDAEGVQDGFEADVKDPRFAALFEEHDFAIDPTNPRFKQTSTMKKLMEEKRNRKKGHADNDEDGANCKKRKAETQAGDDMSRLVQSLKRKSKSK
ncbi:pre-rRNA processing protein Esf1 [Tirmania nivea]|nr:pre-rRNA processing protein Esf1 [Tirmania nivea]